MTRLLMSGVAVAALMAFGSMAGAQQQQQQQPTVQTMPSQGGGASTAAPDNGGGGAAAGGTSSQMQDETQPGTTKQPSSGSMQKQTDQTKSGDKTKKSAAGQDSSGATGATGKAGKIDIPEAKRGQVAKSFSSHKVKASDVNIDVSIGVAVPTTVVLHPVPADVVVVVPAFRHYRYFVLASGEIVIVDPATMVVVYVLAA